MSAFVPHAPCHDEVGIRERGIVIGLTMLLIGGMWTSGFWIRKGVECFKWGLMDDSNRIMEDTAEGDVNCRGQIKKFQREDITKWPRDCCDILGKKMCLLSASVLKIC